MQKSLILEALAVADIDGFGGECGEAAQAINEVFFDGEGSLVLAVNKHAKSKGGPFIGHVACRGPDGCLWDCDGRIKKEDLRGWAMLDPGWAVAEGLSEEERQDAQLREYSDEMAWKIYTDGLPNKESAESKAEVLNMALENVTSADEAGA